MSTTVFLDAGPLGLITNPKRTSDTIAASESVFNMEAAGHRLLCLLLWIMRFVANWCVREKHLVSPD